MNAGYGVRNNTRPYRKRKNRRYGGKISYGKSRHEKYGGSKAGKGRGYFRSSILRMR